MRSENCRHTSSPTNKALDEKKEISNAQQLVTNNSPVDGSRLYLRARGAKAGQTMSGQDYLDRENAVFQIYYHGEEESLPGAGDAAAATNWSGQLPVNNEYMIVVGGTRGNATYALTTSIK